jgi:hypothetical protein
MSCLALLGFPS